MPYGLSLSVRSNGARTICTNSLDGAIVTISASHRRKSQQADQSGTNGAAKADVGLHPWSFALEGRGGHTQFN
jgi:hypothetical protein